MYDGTHDIFRHVYNCYAAPFFTLFSPTPTKTFCLSSEPLFTSVMSVLSVYPSVQLVSLRLFVLRAWVSHTTEGNASLHTPHWLLAVCECPGWVGEMGSHDPCPHFHDRMSVCPLLQVILAAMSSRMMWNSRRQVYSATFPPPLAFIFFLFLLQWCFLNHPWRDVQFMGEHYSHCDYHKKQASLIRVDSNINIWTIIAF